MTTHKPSKSAKKREVLVLQDLGEQLIGLTEEQLDFMELPENLIDAVVAASKIKARGAQHRQCQLIGKLMRDVDPEPIRLAIDGFKRRENAEKEIFRRAEHWRDRIVQDEHLGLNEFFEMTGDKKEDLSSMLNEYLGNPDAAARRALRREIFRQVHGELSKATIGR